MFGIGSYIMNALRCIGRVGRKSCALRELEMIDQSALNDLGMSRGGLIGLSHGSRAGRCAAY